MLLMIDNERTLRVRFGGCFTTASAQATAAVTAPPEKSR
jgi:hypothetical protein